MATQPESGPRKPSIIDERDVPVTSVFSQTHEHAIIDDDAVADDKTLGALGYKQEFKRDFSMVESFSVSFSVMGLVPSVASTLSFGLGYAGTGGAVWGWIIASIFTQSTAFAIAELCSSMPTAGGLYYASAVLAPPGWGPFASWIVGWSNFLGFVVGPCSFNYVLATMIVTAAQIANSDYTPQNWHIYLLMIGLLILNGVVTMQRTKFIGWVNKIGTVWNLIIILILIIWFPVGSINSPKTNNSRDVWTSFENGTEWPIGWATIMGFLTTIFTMAGYDAPFHLSEEASNANIAGPRAIVLTAQTGMYLGLAIILVVVYTVKDVQEVVAGPYGQPFGSLCLQVLGQRPGLAMFGLNMVAQFFCAQACTITATRIVFAYARDGALPFSKWWAYVNPRTTTPVNATWGVLAIGALLGLLLFAGPIAILAVFQIAAIAQYTSFTIPIILKLFYGQRTFRPGPWNLGKFSSPVGVVSIAWWLFLLPPLCFPAARGADLTPQNMNWTCLIYGGPMLIVTVWWIVSARKWFKGPRINIMHTNTLDAVNVDGTRDRNVAELKFKL